MGARPEGWNAGRIGGAIRNGANNNGVDRHHHRSSQQIARHDAQTQNAHDCLTGLGVVYNSCEPWYCSYGLYILLSVSDRATRPVAPGKLLDTGETAH